MIRQEHISPESIPLVGSDRYSVRRRLGSGGFGVVYEAYDHKRSAPVALKFLKDASTLLQFKDEFRALADIQHPNLVRLHELATNRDQWFLTMELVDGKNFRDYVWTPDSAPEVPGSSDSSPTVSMAQEIARELPVISSRIPLRRSGTFHEERLRRTLSQLASGVAALHAAGKLHRDLKPSNVLVSSDGRVVLLDFGLVADMDADSYARTVHIVGTPSYMSPEQGVGKPLTEASDWYSVGVMLYEALTGALPFSGSATEVLFQKRHMEAAAPSQVKTGIPPDLNLLCRDLLRTDPENRPAGADILARMGGGHRKSRWAALPGRPRHQQPFIGREDHLTALHDAYRTMRSGSAVIVALHGTSGVGKTTLVQHFLDDLRQQDASALLLAGRCYEQESVPYKGFDSLMDACCRHLQSVQGVELERILPRDILALARLFPVLMQVPGVNEGRRRIFEIQDSQELRRRAFAAQRELLARLADQRPVVLFIDDLQWGDMDTAALIAEILRPPDPPNVLFIAAFRSDQRDTPVYRVIENLRNQQAPLDVRELAVSELPIDSARELVLALASQGTVPLERADAIARESGGSPIFIGELLHSLGDAHSAGLSLDAAIHGRVRALPEAARRMLEILAVTGQPVSWPACAEAAGVTPEARAPALDVLRAARMVRAHQRENRECFEVYHARIAETVLSHIAEAEKKDCHGRVGRALEVAGEADAETLYVHARGAARYPAAARYAETAATQAATALAFDRAARLYRSALELGDGNDVWRRQMSADLGDVLRNAGRGLEAAEAYLAAAAGARSHNRIELERRAAEELLRSGHVDRGLVLVRSVLGELHLAMPESPRMALIGLLARRLQIRLRGLRYQERSAETLNPDQLLRLDACWSASVGLSMVDTIRGAYFHVRHLLLALEAGEPARVVRALALEVTFSANCGGRQRKRTDRISRQVTMLAERVQDPQGIGLAHLMRGIAYFLEGRWKGAVDHCSLAEQIFRERCTGIFEELDSSYHFHLRSLYWMGELKELALRLPALLKDADDRGDLYGKTMLSIRNLYILHLAADLHARARQETREAIERWSQQGFHNQHYVYLCAQTEMDLYLGDGTAAWSRITEGWKGLKRSLLLRVQFALLEATHLRARCALAAAVSGAPDLLSRAAADAAVIEKENMPWANPLAATIRAGIALASGRRQTAIALLASAENELTAQDMRLYAAAAMRRRGELTGGGGGQHLIEAADRFFTRQGVVNPSRLAAMLLPGRYAG